MPRKATEKTEKKLTSKTIKSTSTKASKEVKKKNTPTPQKGKTGNRTKKEIDNHSQNIEQIKETTSIIIENPTKDPEFLIKLFKLITTPKKATKTRTKKATTTKKSSVSRKKKKEEAVSPIFEYYDLPYRYNETVVKLLAQTPNILFVYWDISDQDRQHFIEQYGDDFFQNTKPVLIVHNKTKQYAFEVEINDFANCWYLHVDDAKCDYMIELGRRPKNAYVYLPDDYLYISSSNDLESPNDHILFEKMQNYVLFQNVKTHQTYRHAVSTILSQTSGKKPLTIYELYQSIYEKELVTFNDRMDFSNPSSGNPSSTFR